ncbi:MAG TPA: hypothetical protein VI229_00305 [Burkholderiales bacterium]
MKTTVGKLIEALLRHGDMNTRVFVIDERGGERPLKLTSGTNINGIRITPAHRRRS